MPFWFVRAPSRLGLPILLIAFLGAGLRAQTGLTAWNRDGQTWLVWTDNLTFSGIESVSIHRSSAPITTLADLQAAERIGRLYPQDYEAARLQASAPGARWTIPDAAGTPFMLAANQGLFVYTPHDAVPEYFAVVKTENLATGPFTSVGPIAQTLDPVVPHLQHSGVDANHPYDVYTFWIDGRADHTSGVPGFPVMGSPSCNGVASLFAVFEPRVALPPAPVPCVVFLHGGSGNHWTYRPSESNAKMIDLHFDSGIYVTPEENLFLAVAGNVADASHRWFGTCETFDRFADVNVAPPAGTLVVDYSHRRLEWILDWLEVTRGIDPKRTAMAGLSNGGRGTHIFSRALPQRLSAALAFVMPAEFEVTNGAAIMGTPALALPTTLPGGPTTFDVIDPMAPLSDLDRPFVRYVDGTHDTEAPWTNKPLVLDTLNAQRTGAAMYWDGRGHTASSPAGWAGQHFTGSPKLGLENLARYRSDQSFPAFHDVDHDLGMAGQQPDPGDPVVPANGNAWGTWGGFFEWDPQTIVDLPNSWSCRVWLETAAAWPADNAPLPNARAGVTLRRLQQFVAAPNEVLWVRLVRTVAPFQVQFAGAVQAGADGTITIPNLPFGPQRLDLFVERASAGGPLVPYGIGTAGCPGIPTITANPTPRVNTPTFAVLHGNAPPNGVGVGVFGFSAANVLLLGFQLHVDFVTIPGVLLLVTSDPLGAGQMALPLANDPALAGVQWFAQDVWLDGCAPQGLSASRGLVITIQP